MVLIDLVDVTKSYHLPGGEKLDAVSEITASLSKGETIAVTGRSGSGKSTLIHLLAGIDNPSQGLIRFDGRDISSLRDSERTILRRDAIGLVFQFFHLLPHLSVLQNVLLPCWIAGERDGAGKRRAEGLLHRVGLRGREHQTVEKLSGGEMQRVAICRALVRCPRLLLADEPTGNLDDETGLLVMEQLMSLVAEEGSTLLYVTHSAELAALADRKWTLHSGRLEAP